MKTAAVVIGALFVPALVHATPNALMESFERGVEQASAEVQQAKAGAAAPPVAEAAVPVATPPALVSENAELGKLVAEIHALRAKVGTVERNSLATQRPSDRKKVGSKVFFNHQEGAIYDVHAGVDRVTDIELAADETLTGPPVAGDTVRWKTAIVKSGTEAGEATHVLLKPLEEGIETNLILTTTKRTYHLRVTASDWYMPAVAWNYPDVEARRLEQELQRKRVEQPLAVDAAALSFDYRVSEERYDWRPIRVFDDGTRTYLQMGEGMRVDEAPAFFILDEDGEPMLANYRVKGMYYVVDRLFERAELRLGKSKVVSIINNRRYRPTFWERLF